MSDIFKPVNKNKQKDPFDPFNDINKDTATAQLIKALIENEPEKITVLTDLKPIQINALTALNTFGDWLKANGVEIKEIDSITKHFTRLRISKDRASRKELIKAIQQDATNKEEENSKGIKRILGL